MKAYVFGGMLVLSAALAACSSSEGDTGTGGGSGGGSGEGGGGDGGSTTTGSPTSTTGTTTPATTSTTTTTTTGGGEGVCGTGLSFDQGGALDTCIDANCCTEFTACAGADGSNADACNACLEAGGGALCDSFVACADENQCGGGATGICDSGLSTQDPDTDQCLGDACCAEFQACTQNGADIDACVACFEAEGGPLCDAAIACSDESGCFGSAEGVCGTGLTFDQGGPLDTCIDDNCCTEFTACAGADGANADACNACLEAGSGALCDDFLACAETNGCG